MKGFWSHWFRFGLYDHFMPINYDRSIGEAFQLLSPRAADRVADFGSGNGRLLVHAKSWLEGGGTLEGFDIDDEGRAYAQLRAKRLGLERPVTFHLADLRELDRHRRPLFDGAIAHFSLYTIPKKADREKALSQMAKLLKPEARLIVSVPSEHYRIARIIAGAKQVETERNDASWALRQFRKNVLYRVTEKAMMPIEKALDAGKFRRFTPQAISEEITTAGLKPERVIPSYSGCGYHIVATPA